MGVEGLFMEWIIRALKPNGKAFVVVPDGLFNRKNDTKLRKFNHPISKTLHLLLLDW
jgi:adenine-specific DNA methylase